jgi:hypothetical protein
MSECFEYAVIRLYYLLNNIGITLLFQQLKNCAQFQQSLPVKLRNITPRSIKKTLRLVAFLPLLSLTEVTVYSTAITAQLAFCIAIICAGKRIVHIIFIRLPF